jgi:hypothetical protein
MAAATKIPRTVGEVYAVARALENAHNACENALYKGADDEEAELVTQAAALIQKALDSLRQKHNVG